MPVLLFCLANWCLTTLFDGEGSFKDIYIAVTYSLTPLPFMVILSTILTNVLTKTESTIVGLLVTFGYIWVGLLIFFGMMTTHDYTLGKNFITTIGTILGMAFIMFLGVLFTSLVMDVMSFVTDIVAEGNVCRVVSNGDFTLEIDGKPYAVGAGETVIAL